MAHARRRHDDDVIADDPRRDDDVTDDVTGDDDADYLRGSSSSSRPNYDAEMRLRERVSIHSLLLLYHCAVVVTLPTQANWLTRSVLFFSRPRSDGWPHHGRTFSIYPCPLSF